MGLETGSGGGSKKSAEMLLYMLKNADSNAELKGLDVDLVIEHIRVNRARKMRPGIYRANDRMD